MYIYERVYVLFAFHGAHTPGSEFYSSASGGLQLIGL